MKLKNDRRTRILAKTPGERHLAPVIGTSGIKLNRILVPVDFSDSSRKALQYAVSFARLFKAEILLLHVVQSLPAAMPGLVGEGVIQGAELREEGTKHLALWCKTVKEQVPAVARIEDGNPAEVIARVARDSESDMIIVATHGRTGLERLLLGGTSKKVVRVAPCPVLVVREQEHDFLTLARDPVVTRRRTRPVKKRPTHRRRG
jgi:universal stress protein A